jgi:hypothetical protein
MNTAMDTAPSDRQRPSIDSTQGSSGWVMPLTLLSATWLLAIVVAGTMGVFDAGPGRPPLALLAVIVVPPALFLVAYRISAEFRRLVLSLDLRLLTAYAIAVVTECPSTVEVV